MIIIDKSTNFEKGALDIGTSKLYYIYIPDEYYCFNNYNTNKTCLILNHFFVIMHADGVGNIYDKKYYEKIYKFEKTLE